ncbi:hypothetical protein BH11MYX1_BH11MYX1_42380 [soil metagenome]
MTTGFPARVAICVVLATLQAVRPALADDPPATDADAPVERRQVAIIDLTEDDQVRTLSGALYTAINQSDGLMIPNTRDYDRDLTGHLVDEDGISLNNATNARAEAQASLDETKASDAGTVARRGEQDLARIVPTADAQALYAELSILVGLAALDQGHAQESNLALSLAQRLDPSRQLDPARYPPDVVAAWKRAVDSKPELVTLEVKGTGRVWIDFVERGPAPGVFKDLEVGDHVITVTGFDRKTWGEPHDLIGTTILVVKDDPADNHQKVARARLALSRAQASGDDVARAGAMHQLATLLGVGDAVMISKRPDHRIQWETWRDRAPGFSAPKEFTTQRPEEMIEGLSGPRRPLPGRPEILPFKPPIVLERRWYEKRWVQASAAGTLLAVVVGGILIAYRTQTQLYSNDIKVAN